MEYSIDIQGEAGPTVRLAATDVAQLFDRAQTTVYVGDKLKPAIAVTLTCETNMIRIAEGDAVPTQGAAGLGHILYVGQSVRISNPASVRTLRFINHTNGANGFLQATFEFEVGG